MSLREAFRRAGVPVAEPGDPHFRNGWINTQCVFCGSSKYLLGLTEDGRRASCYQCGAKYPARVLRVLLNWNRDQVAEFEHNRLQNAATWEPQTKTLGVYSPPKVYETLTEADRAYLRTRNYSDEKIDAMEYLYGLRSVHPLSGYPFGVFIPICNEKGVPVSWTIRYRQQIDGQRYHTARDEEKTMQEKHLLGWEHLLRERGLNSILLVEGPFDAMAVGPGTCCTFGLAYTPQQLWRISRYPRRYILSDKGASAQNAWRRLAKDLAVFPGQTEQIELEADDPGSASEAEIKELREYVGI